MAGLVIAIRRERTFRVHLIIGTAVVALATFFRLAPWEWATLGLCITLVLTAELLNTALEHLAKAVSAEFNEHVRISLDVGAGAVLTSAIGAAIVGLIVLAPHMRSALG